MSELSLHSAKQPRPFFRAARLMLRDPTAAIMLLRLTGWIAVVSLAANALSLPRVIQLLEPRRRPSLPLNPARSDKIVRLLDWLLAKDLLFLTPTCWKRAPVLRRFMALEGMETRILFGVRRDGDDQLKGHVWLEADGQPVHEREPPEYKITFSYPA